MEYPSGWSCETVEVKLELYLFGSLTWGEALAVAGHLEACVACAQRVVLLRGNYGAGAKGSPSHGGGRGSGHG